MRVRRVADRLAPVGGLADHAHSLGLQQAAQPLTEQRVVIDEQDANHNPSLGQPLPGHREESPQPDRAPPETPQTLARDAPVHCGT
ncbi:hypothetical protein GCM10010844_23230 [Deinococcus radiotolerans]|uniref:Uncharacterized protein n=1 Tax=Deinococcus radiotolerans TaxID=1309407 RepID=A0ABQ2FJD4_9DEIO|nr:hypothetical protein GCM10010844_23230 [Deinococcus radiotolerans]